MDRTDLFEAPTNRFSQSLVGVYFKNLPTSFVSIDFETLYSDRRSACAVGMVKYINGDIADRYYTLICPPREIKYKGAIKTDVHGFTWDSIKDAKTMVDVLPEMDKFINGLPLVAHNAKSVERACIQQTAEYYNISHNINLDIFDTIDIAKQIEEGKGRIYTENNAHKLTTVCFRFGVPVLTHHKALDDAEMCGNLFCKFGRILRKEEIVTLREKTLPDIDAIRVENNPFLDKTIVLTHIDPDSYRAKVKDFLMKLGAKKVPTSVSKKTDILLYGDGIGPNKKEKAETFGTQLMSEYEFYTIIQSLQ